MEQKKRSIIPYLSFEGNCEEAVNAYIRAFGGEIYCLSRWDEQNSDGMSGLVGKVMHVEFAVGSTHMAAGDIIGGPGRSTDLRLMVHMDFEEEARHAISVLADGGTILAPLKPHPKPDDGGCGSSVKDRFGITWIITCPNPDK